MLVKKRKKRKEKNRKEKNRKRSPLRILFAPSEMISKCITSNPLKGASNSRQFSRVIPAATCNIPMWLWRSLINLSESLPRWSVWLSRDSGLKLPFMDLVLYLWRSFSAISQTFTFSISTVCCVSPPAEGSACHKALKSSCYSFPDTVAERTKPIWATCLTLSSLN